VVVAIPQLSEATSDVVKSGKVAPHDDVAVVDAGEGHVNVGAVTSFTLTETSQYELKPCSSYTVFLAEVKLRETSDPATGDCVILATTQLSDAEMDPVIFGKVALHVDEVTFSEILGPHPEIEGDCMSMRL
jgi:hypothetical protein